MGFTTDKQTLDDLNIIGKHGSHSVYAIFNRTLTRGGAELMDEMFRNPLSNRVAIDNRAGVIGYFKSTKAEFPFHAGMFDTLEQYLGNTDERSKLSVENNTLARKLTGMIAEDTEYKIIFKGVMAAIELLHHLRDFVIRMRQTAPGDIYQAELTELNNLLSDQELAPLLPEKATDKLPFEKIAAYDVILRFRQREKIEKILRYVYMLDVYLAVARVALERGFVFPQALAPEQHTLRMGGVYHPLVKNAVANTIYITPQSNIVFLTGANMAGKSTLMKSMGIALYLAHMGFPVPAKKMEFSVRDGMYTTINLPDDLSSGNSHFYAEVLRVKKIAKELGVAKNLFIIFDELFRGTNVKDAYEGTIAITGAFAEKQNCMFVVSTHIIEAGEVLRERYNNINFVYMPTLMDQNTPVYTYKLESGITADRHGMVIINNEKILQIIRSRKNKTAAL